MRLEALELHHLSLPLRTPWRTSGGELTHREVLVAHVRSDLGEGWGECAAFADPFYSPETIATSRTAIERELWPALIAAPTVSAAEVAGLLAGSTGNRMAKSCLEMALLDLELRSTHRSFAEFLGATTDSVPAGGAIGLQSSTTELTAAVEGFLAAGYRRVKLKVGPGHDTSPLGAVRALSEDLVLVADANGAYGSLDPESRVRELRRLDGFGLACLEQPLAWDDLDGHAALARELATPICLDESLRSLDEVRAALDSGACSVVNLKAGRVGGYLEAVRIVEHCRERRAGLWCGGMLETGLGRAANIALAALDGITLPGDLSGSERFYTADITTEPIVVTDGSLQVPTGVGFGVEIDPEALERLSVR